jgi:homoaconitase/3-isopropylmalate dehydratase large subunit
VLGDVALEKKVSDLIRQLIMPGSGTVVETTARKTGFFGGLKRIFKR